MRCLSLPPLIAMALVGVADAATKPAPVAPNPALVARVNGIDDEQHRRSLPIADLKVDVRLVGSIARTTLRVRFANPTKQWLEGQLSLALPDSATVTGYALNIEDRLIDGVLSEPSRARAAYEERVRETIDPGLAEVSRGNVFSTRVYPIDDEKGRTLRVTFVAPVHAQAGWVLPLATTARIPRVTLNVRAEGVTAPPDLTLPSQLKSQWKREGDAFVATASVSNQVLSGELRFAPAVATQPVLATTHPNGRWFFQLNDVVPADAAARAAPERVRLYWDRSLSRKDDAVAEEIDLVARYLDSVKPRAVDVVLFNSSGVTVETVATTAAVQGLLKGVVYRGGTSFALLQSASVPAAEMCLMFSDGVGTIDRRDTFKPGCELFAVTSAPDADVGYLARLMATSTNAVLRLDRTSADDVISRLRYRMPAIVEVRDASGASLPFASLPAPRGHVAAVGEVPAAGEIVVRIGGSGTQLVERRYPVSNAPTRFEGAGALWAADQVLQLAVAERRKELRTVSRRFGVASPHMAFVVLENPEDYAQARIAPPASYPKELRAQYVELKAEYDADLATERERHLAKVIEKWEAQKHWWETPFNPAAAGPPSDRLRREAAPAADASSMLSEVQVTGARRESGAAIEVAPWNVDRPYIKALDAASKARLERVLAAQEKAFGELPAFYFDVAEWFHRRGQSARAVEMLLSALELPTSNDETLIVVADRLVRYGQLDRAVWLFERLIELAPDRPQPRRSLALALAERSKRASPAVAARDLKRAVGLLNEVAVTPWVEAYDGIELVSLMEANALIPRLKKLGVTKTILDPRLVALLDVDLRVVIEWNTAATDMDLWVKEPNGELAMYSNPLTQIGGRLSNDMTFGFGPEEYLLRRAPDGRFSVDVNVFAADRLNPNGATSVTARLIHDFGRPGERTEMLDLELDPDDEGAVPLGAFILANKGAGFTAMSAPKDRTDEDSED
jgi:hypothetical protein